MGTNQHIFKTRFSCCLLIAVVAACNLFAYEVTVGEATVWPGISVQVPVLLDDVADVSTVQFQINYDPQLLMLLSVTNAPGTLGSAFSLDYEDDDGLLLVRLYREDSLLSGSGELVSLVFSANMGAEIDMESALTLADVELGGQNGKDLSWQSLVIVAHGSLRVFPSESADADGDGIPDRWEYQYSGGITNLLASMNSDGDMLDNWQEYVAGLNPTNFDGFVISGCESGSEPVIHWNSVSGRVYSVYWASNLLHGFTLLQSNISWSAGCFTNMAHDGGLHGYYKLDVRLAPAAE